MIAQSRENVISCDTESNTECFFFADYYQKERSL